MTSAKRRTAKHKKAPQGAFLLGEFEHEVVFVLCGFIEPLLDANNLITGEAFPAGVVFGDNQIEVIQQLTTG